MSLLHGTVRATLGMSTGASLAELTGRLNAVLHGETPEERYATFFWAELDQAAPRTSAM